MNIDEMSNENVGAVRTSANMTVLTALCALLAKWRGWTLQVDDLLPYTPIILAVTAGFYRLSRVMADRWPWLGYVLFGIVKKPAYVDPPALVIEAGDPGHPKVID